MIQVESWTETHQVYRVHCQYSECDGYNSEPTTDWELNEERRKAHWDFHHQEESE